jgi:hypothetical protein
MPTLKQLLEKGELFQYGIDYRKVEAEKQTLSDFEDNGLRVNFGQRFGDLPNFGNLTERLYGNETLRITKQSTALVDDMKANTNANQGLLGGVIGSVTKTVNNFASALGFPVLQIPTRVSDDNRLSLAIKRGDNVMVALSRIKRKQEGNILGKFLKQTAEGTPSQIGRRAIGTAKNMAKNAAKNLLFGNGSGGVNQAQKNTLSLSGESITYGSYYRNKYSYKIRRSGNSELGVYTLLNNFQNKEPDIEDFLFSAEIRDIGQRPNVGSKEKPSESFPKFPQFSVDSITQNIPGKRDKTNRYTDSSNPIMDLRMDIPSGKFNTKYDLINQSSVWSGSTDGGTPPTLEDGTTYDDYDFIPFRFYSVAKEKGVSFKATLSGITETFSPSWESSNFIGNPYSFYTYQSINRKVDFTFLMYSLSATEHKKIWEKVDFLSSLTYPQNIKNNVYVTPPLLKMTMGSMYKNKLGFIESLSYTIDDNTPWEIGYEFNSDDNLVNNGSLRNYKLPKIINVTISYQIIETSSDVVGKKLYAYGGPIASVDVGEGQFGDFEL